MTDMDRKWVTEPDDYVCSLSEETQKIALDELGEEALVRTQALESMRTWIMQNPKILNCRLDSKFILRFLRGKKYRVVQAQEAIQRYLLLRSTFGVAFTNLDIRIPMMVELTELGFAFACPKRDSKGRRVVVVRPGVFDLYKFTSGDMLRIAGILGETLMEDEENQIRGYVYFADGQGVGLSYITLFTPREVVRLIKNGEKILPMRHKEVHGINVHPSMKFICEFALSLLSDKIRKRVKIYTSVKEMLNSGNIEVDVLPKEYGGTIPMAEMIALWKDELQKSHATLMSHDEMRVKEDMFTFKQREGAVSALKYSGTTCGSEEDALYGVTGNFRKLEVD